MDSTLNKGTTFTVTLNLKTDDNKNLTNVDVPNINVLVLNNNKNELEYTRTCLESLNINVTTTTSYSDALDKLNLAHAKSEDYFAILIDNSINDIIVGVYGNIHEKDTETKIKQLKQFRDRLSEPFNEDYIIALDRYCYVIASDRKQKKLFLSK